MSPRWCPSPVSEPLAVGLPWPLVHACLVGDVRGPCRAQASRPPCVFHPVREHLRQPRGPVGAHMSVYGLLMCTPSCAARRRSARATTPSSSIMRSTRHHSSSGSLRLPLKSCLRLLLADWAYFHTHSPDGLEFRLVSQLTVDFDTPISRAMRDLLHFLWRPV